MSQQNSFDDYLVQQGVSRRAFIKLCSSLGSLLALPVATLPALADQLRQASRPAVIWLSFQECTGCTESFTRSHSLTLEDLIFNFLSLDYHHTLQAAAGEAAEAARRSSMQQHYGSYLLIVEGSIPLGQGGACSTIAGRTNLDLLQECSAGAAAVMAIGSCAVFSGLPGAAPNPTGATGVADLMRQGLIALRPLVNIPGCPPLPVAISAVLAHFLLFNRFPPVDEQGRPLSIYAETVHDRCSRVHFFEQEKFALSFDDEGARKGWCLYKLGCKGPVTHNACAVLKWNKKTSFPVQSGHGCLGCSEPGFWDKGGFYRALDDAGSGYSPPAITHDAAISEGQQLYETNCVYCHAPNPAELKTPAQKVIEVLRSRSLRPHRNLQFSEDQLDALERYLNSKK